MIHKTAIISKSAAVSHTASVGPFCVIGKNVELHDNVELISHVCIEKNTVINKNSKIYPFATIGYAPQDLKYHDEESQVVIGENTTVREHVTIHRGTANGGMKTVVGNGCLLMVGVHIAHDCILGDGVIMANNATLGGHVIVEDYAIIGGLAAIHQFTRIGKHSIIGGLSGVAEDVIPYGSVVGKRAKLVGINLVGMKRHKFNRDDINLMRAIYQKLFGKHKNMQNFNEKVREISSTYVNTQCVNEVITFLLHDSKRSICMPEHYGMENDNDRSSDIIAD